MMLLNICAIGLFLVPITARQGTEGVVQELTELMKTEVKKEMEKIKQELMKEIQGQNALIKKINEELTDVIQRNESMHFMNYK